MIPDEAEQNDIGEPRGRVPARPTYWTQPRPESGRGPTLPRAAAAAVGGCVTSLVGVSVMGELVTLGLSPGFSLPWFAVVIVLGALLVARVLTLPGKPRPRAFVLYTVIAAASPVVVAFALALLASWLLCNPTGCLSG